MIEPVSLNAVFDTFDAVWEPRIVARVNDYDVKIARGEGRHPRHSHPETDEFFMVLAGELRIDLPETDDSVTLRSGDTYVVPRGTEHQPTAASGTRFLMFEPRGTGSEDGGGSTGVSAIAG